MLSPEQIKTISNFLLDSAKIIFGSLVVGVFAPSTSLKNHWLTFIAGIILTFAFLVVAINLSKPSKSNL